jgi:hypothetical protein
VAQDDANLPSIVVGPLVVFIQLTQYWRYLELTRADHLGETADLQGEDTSDCYPPLLKKPHTLPEEVVFSYKK